MNKVRSLQTLIKNELSGKYSLTAVKLSLLVSNHCEFVVTLKQETMLGAPVVSSGERNFWKINRAQFQDALFSLVAGLNLIQIQQIQNIRFFSDWLLCSPFFIIIIG